MVYAVIDNPNLTIKPVNNNQPIINSKNKKRRKENKHIAKKKVQLNNLHTLVQAFTTGFVAFLFFYLASISYFELSAFLLFYPKF